MSLHVLRPGMSPAFPPDPLLLRPLEGGLVALGGHLDRDTLLEAYCKGIFPWEGTDPIPWFSPDPRAILVPRAFRAGRSVRKLSRRPGVEVTIDRDFSAVIAACAGVPRPGQTGTWITPAVVAAYTDLHREGIAHSVEVWERGELVGGLYGLAIGRAFFGESMFHRRSDASKLALGHLCGRLHPAGFRFVDCQQDTNHIRSLGAVVVPRLRYLRLLEEALDHPDRWPAVVSRPESD